MIDKLKIAGIVSACSLLASCASTNSFLAERSQLVEYYRIFSFPGTSVPRAQMIEAARTGIAKSGVRVTDSRPIPPAQMPDQSGRFRVANPMQGSQFAAMAGQAAGFLKTADCTGAVWTATTTRTVGSENAVLYLCMWEYRGGYNLDIYGNYVLKEGGISVERMARAVTKPLVGSFEETLERLVNDVAREMQTAAAVPVRYLEGHPEPTGESWWTQDRSITSQRK